MCRCHQLRWKLSHEKRKFILQGHGKLGLNQNTVGGYRVGNSKEKVRISFSIKNGIILDLLVFFLMDMTLFSCDNLVLSPFSIQHDWEATPQKIQKPRILNKRPLTLSAEQGD